MTKTNNIFMAASRLEGKKVLYFEGAGMDFEQSELNGSDVLNHRIRTSFINNDGEQIYLEMGNTYKRDKKGKATEKMGTWVDFCFKVPSNKDDEIKYHEIFKRHEEHLELGKMDYTKENITKWINELLNCDFDTIHVLNRFYGYHVHGDNRSYVPMESIELNHERAFKRQQKYNELDEKYKLALNEKYSRIGIEEMKGDELKIRVFATKEKLEKLGLCDFGYLTAVI